MSTSRYHEGAAYRWNEMPWEIVRPGVRRTAFGNEHVTLVMNELESRHQPYPHSHAEFFQIATIISGSGIYSVGKQASRVGPGSVLMIPAGVEHFISNTGDEPILNLDIFAPARADYSHLTRWMSK